MLIGKRAKILLTSGAVAGLLMLPAIIEFTPKIIYNPSPSAPKGFYFISPETTPKIGSYVLLELPGAVKIMALERHYIGHNIPLLKQVYAMSGDHICIKYDVIYVNYEAVAEVKTYDPSGRKMPLWEGCRMLEDEYFLLSQHSVYSFDSRYFGPVRRGKIIGVAFPVWVRKEVE